MKYLIALTALLLCSACSEPRPASATLVYNARIYTVNPDRPVAEALVFDEAGMILGVGEASRLRSQFRIGAEIDVQGHAVVPGFIDAHAHLMNLGQSMLQARLEGAGSVSETLQRLVEFEATLPPGAWLTGRGWDQNDWQVQEFPDRAVLDEQFPDRPVWLRRIDGHAGWANSVALGAAGLMEASDWQPQGGKILRDSSGVPTGILVDKAMSHIDTVVPPISEQDYERGLALALGETARFGLTGVHEAGSRMADLDRYRRFLAQGRLPLRIYAMAGGMGPLFRHLCDSGPVLAEQGRLTVRTVKLYADGALGSRGAALHEPYADDPENSGLLIVTPEELKRAARSVLECDLQLAVHAIGDLGNTVVVDAVEYASVAVPGNSGRHRNEHTQVIRQEDIERMARLGMIASVQPTHATSDMYWAEERLGPQRVTQAYAWQKLSRAGVRLALGSDFPVESVNPLLGFYAAVTRMDVQGWPAGGWFPEQRLSRTEALKGFTLDAAYAAFQEAELGSLEPGKRADFVVLSADIMQIDAALIPATQVLATYLDGQEIYRLDAQQAASGGFHGSK